jgi:dihydroxyacetone kinase
MSATTVPKKFLNDPTHAVSEYISGLLLQYPTKLQKLPHHNVLLSTNIRLDRVNILSGGGSGHEPSHAGWIGEGMLTGAILGGIFASPSVSSILAAIRAVTIPNPSRSKQEESKGGSGRGGGCLLIVKNYTGDRLNFGMATEIARGEGRNVRMVIVADDTALERQKGVKGGGGGARGVAGTVLVHKVAGAAAKRGYDLDRVAEIATCMARSVRSLGVALNAVTIPGAVVVNDRLMASGGSSSSMIEIGMGIHGEAGRLQSPLKSADELASIMIRTICEYGVVEMEGEDEEKEEGRAVVVVPTFERGEELCVVVNNLGGTSNFEMGILANSVVSQLENEVGVGMGVDVGMGGWGCWVSRLYVGSFMTSFDMQGASVSIVSLSKVKRHLRELLDDDTDAPAWQKSDVVREEGTSRKRMVEESVSASTVLEISSPIVTTEEVTKCDIPVVLGFGSNVLEKAVSAACNRLIESEPILTKYDTIVGDGDCGITMERGAKEILSRLESKVIDTSHPVVFFEHLAVAISSSMGGTSGILLEIMCRKMSTTLKAQTLIDGDAMKNAFEQGVKAVSFYGGATLGSRTMLDALLPAVEVMKSSPCDNLTDVAKAASEGALATAFMSKASAGRSNYLSEDTLRGTPDPGAIAVGLVLSAISTVLSF